MAALDATRMAVVTSPTNMAVVTSPTSMAVVTSPTNMAVVTSSANVALVTSSTGNGGRDVTNEHDPRDVICRHGGEPLFRLMDVMEELIQYFMLEGSRLRASSTVTRGLRCSSRCVRPQSLSQGSPVPGAAGRGRGVRLLQRVPPGSVTCVRQRWRDV